MSEATARVTLRHAGVKYAFDFPHPYDDRSGDLENGMLFHWTEGNYGCDCNRILFIDRYCDVDLAPDVDDEDDLPCGHSIALVKLEAVYGDGTVTEVYPAQIVVDERLTALGLRRHS